MAAALIFASSIKPTWITQSLSTYRHIQVPIQQYSSHSRHIFKQTSSIQCRSHSLKSGTRWKNLWPGVKPRVTSSPFRALTLLPGFTLFPGWLKKDNNHNHALSEEVMSHIPKEVLQEPKKKKKRNFILRFLLGIWEWIHFTGRFIRILVTFVPLLCAYPFVCWNDRLRLWYWKVLLYTLQLTGATFIKLGQWAGTRRDLFSPEFCDLFSVLHVRTRVHAWHITKYKLRKAFGKRWREILVKVHKKPIGSGCIAQVHKAYIPVDMIPDGALVDEILIDAEDDHDDEPEIDFADGLEVIGLGGISDEIEDMVEEFHEPRKRAKNLTLTEPHYPSHSSDDNSPDPLDPGDEPSDPATDPDTDPKNLSQAKVLPPSESGHTTAPPGEEEEDVPLIPVAVKVLHPGVYRAVKRDLRIMGSLVSIVEKLVPSLRWLSLHECMEEFSNLLINQIDLRVEAKGLDKFVANFEDNPNIRFPKPIRPYCKRSVLVETYEEGEPLTNYLLDAYESPVEGLKEKIASLGIDALLQMIFVDNFVHGDLHPGNILVQNAEHFTPQEENKFMLMDLGDTVILNVKTTDCPLRLVMLDVGITSSLSNPDLENFKAVFTAVVLGDGAEAADLMLKHARRNECKDVEKFKQELGHIVTTAREESISLGKIQVGRLLSDVFTVLSKHQVKMESNFASVLLAIFVLEGLGRSLDPNLDILDRAKPILLS